MFKTWLRKLHRLSRRLWVRVFIISVMGFVALGLAKLFDPLIPAGFSDVIGADALDRLLEIIATSMLTTTTFSLTVMVTVHRSASQQWTPRAHRTLLSDTTTQTVLATFIGAYIYALTVIVLLSTPVYGENEIVVLYIMTVLVIALIVTVILRWILKLQVLGSLTDTAKRIEEDATEALRTALQSPCLGGHCWDDAAAPEGTVVIRASEAAYVQSIYEDILQVTAQENDLRVWIAAPLGRFVHRDDVLLYVTPCAEEVRDRLLDNIRMGANRTNEQDPRFGLIQLSEIGSKALSPGINDPGTAIDVIGRLARILDVRLDPKTEPGPRNDRLWARPLAPDDLLTDAYAAIARDGAGLVEVHIALQKALAALSRNADPQIGRAARRMAALAWRRAQDGLSFAPDRDRLDAATHDAVLREAADPTGAEPGPVSALKG